MPSRQKAKGNNFERTIAKHLSTVFNLNFERVPTSGAMTGGINQSVLNRLSDSQKLLLEGDLIPPDELYHIKIECKSHKTFSFSSLFSSNKLLQSWLEQSYSDSKLWFLIFKINNKGTFVGFDIKHKDDFKYNNFLVYDNSVITSMVNFFEDNDSFIKEYSCR